MERAHTNARELAEKAGVGRSFVYDVLSGKSANPTTHKLAAVAEALGVSVSFLLYGEDGYSSDMAGGRASERLPHSSEVVSIPSIAVQASMGGGMLINDEPEDKPFYFQRAWVRDHLRASPTELRVIEVRGDSMIPTLCEGDIILVRITDKNPSPPGIFVLFDGFGLVVKRLEMEAEGKLRILSDNPQYGPYTRPLAEVRVIGRVVWFARELV